MNQKKQIVSSIETKSLYGSIPDEMIQDQFLLSAHSAYNHRNITLQIFLLRRAGMDLRLGGRSPMNELFPVLLRRVMGREVGVDLFPGGSDGFWKKNILFEKMKHFQNTSKIIH